MARPIWKGSISFGLVNIPVHLFTAEKPSEQLHFHLLDKKTHSRIHNQRINEKGTPVAWEDIQKAYEFEKGKYTVIDPKMLEKIVAKNYETVEISNFVPLNQIDPFLFQTPYYLLPGESGLKGYALLHDILQRTKKVGVASVVIKTRQHLAIILPVHNLLGLIILRYANELHAVEDFSESNPLISKKIKISAREIELAEQLVNNMSSKWQPQKFSDKSKELLLKLIKTKIKHGKTITEHPKSTNKKETTPMPDSDKIYDFMELLKKSVIEKEKRKTKHK